MGLAHWWMLLVWVMLVVALVVIYRKGKLKMVNNKAATRIAHSERITKLPEYQAAKRRYRRMAVMMLVLFVIAICSSVFLSARPSKQSLVTPAQRNRDIMLCLDVSRSMEDVDAEILSVYEKLARDFEGQRIGLDIYNYNVSQVFPLTDDYDLVNEQLTIAKNSMSARTQQGAAADDSQQNANFYDFVSGTGSSGMNIGTSTASGFPSSNTGLGLAGCVQHLGDNALKRSQSIILATDNELGGVAVDGVITTPQAMALAKQKGIRVYAIDPGHSGQYTADTSTGEHAELKTYSLMTSGGYYQLSDGGLIPDIIQSISAQEAKLFVGDSQVAYTDTPHLAYVVLILAVMGAFFVTWRLDL